jgi:hypothetical protein
MRVIIATSIFDFHEKKEEMVLQPKWLTQKVKLRFDSPN